MSRKPAVAGYFYPATKESIESLIESFDTAGGRPEPAFGVVAPHAGYKYSGPVAAKVYSRLRIDGSVILLGPNHGAGRTFELPPKAAITARGEWELPTGDLVIDNALAAALMEEAPILTDAPWAHEEEHSLEVQAPFIQHFCGDVHIAPIVLSQLSDDEVMELADGVYRAIKRSGKNVTLIASSDFSHYVPHRVAKERDMMAIRKIEALDAPGLIEVVRKEKISMCGYLATAVVIRVCKQMGAKKATLIDYQTSGDVTGDYTSVVGYGGLIIR